MKLSQTSLWFLLLPAIVGVHADRCGACYSDFNTLKRDIESVGSKQLGVFTVCPNTVLTADGSSLGIQFKATGATYKLQCGSSGERSNNCIIEGGPRHLSPGNSALGTNSLASINMEIKGMTFRGASTSSVFVQPTSTGDYTFRDCLWEENTSSSGAGAVHFTNAITSNDVTFTNCFFVRNKGKPGAIYYPVNALGRDEFAVDQCVFLENESTEWAAAISYPEINLSNSCFVGNVASQGGALVYIGERLHGNSNNYARNNSVGTVPPWSTCSQCGPPCNDGVYESGGLVGPADDECHRFGGTMTCLPESCLSEDPPCGEISTLPPQAVGSEEDVECNDDTCVGHPGQCGNYGDPSACNKIIGCTWTTGFCRDGPCSTPARCYGDPKACWMFNGDRDACLHQGTCQWSGEGSGTGSAGSKLEAKTVGLVGIGSSLILFSNSV